MKAGGIAVARRLLLGLAAAAAVCVVVFMLKALKPVLLPFAIALFLFYLADPGVQFLSRRGVPRFIGVALMLFLVLAALMGGLAVASRGAVALAKDAPRYEARIKEVLGRAGGFWAERLPERARRQVPKGLGLVGDAAGVTALVFAYLAFLLIEAPRSRERWRRALPGHADEIVAVIDKLEHRMVRFLRLQTIVSAGTALVFWLILRVHGIELAALWSLLNFVSQYVPNIGPIVSSVPPVAMALLAATPEKALSLAASLLCSQFVIGNFIEPMAIGHGMRLDPISVLLGIVFFGWLWGIAGAFLAVPILVGLKTICEEVPVLRPFAGLLEGTERSDYARLRRGHDTQGSKEP